MTDTEALDKIHRAANHPRTSSSDLASFVYEVLKDTGRRIEEIDSNPVAMALDDLGLDDAAADVMSGRDVEEVLAEVRRTEGDDAYEEAKEAVFDAS